MKAQVLLPKIFNFSFTYKQKKKKTPGDIVEVPFWKRKGDWCCLEKIKFLNQKI